MFERNPYDLTEPFELQDDEVTRIARRAERRRVWYTVLSVVLIAALAGITVWKIYNGDTGISLEICLILYVVWMAARTCLRFAGDYHDKKILQKKRKELDLGKDAPYEYNLVHYRTIRHMGKSSKRTLLLGLARQDLLLDRPKQARMALAEITQEDLKKNELQTYYLYQAAASYFLGDEKWKLQMEQCIAIPIKGAERKEQEIRELFAGDTEKLKEALSVWGTENQKKFEKLPPAIHSLGILLLATGIFAAVELLFPSGTEQYYQNSLILLTGFYLAWVAMSVWWLILLCMLVQTLVADGRKSKGLLILWFVLVWLACNLFGILAWANLGTKMEERRTGSIQEALVDVAKALADKADTEQPDANGDSTEAEEDSSSPAQENETGQNDDVDTKVSDNTENGDAVRASDGADTDSGKRNENMPGKIILSGGTTEAERQRASDPITAEQFKNFKIPEKLSEQGIFNEQDDVDTILAGNYLGTWYDETGQESFRLTEDAAYVYIPYLDKYGDEPYKWEIVTDHSDVHEGVELDIYFSGPDIAPLVYYIDGYRGDCFWSILQADVFYRQ